MTDKEKAQAYDEALNWMRTRYPNLSGVNKENAEHLFPQLRESEDERIIRILKEGLEGLTVFNYTPVDKILDWLEKQKAARNESNDENEDERIRKALINYFKAHNALVGENWNGIECDDVIAYLEKQKEASKAIEAVERIDRYIDEHVTNAHDMKDSNPDKKYYRGFDDALGKMAGILQDVYSNEKQKEREPVESISHLPVQGKGVYKICPHCKERMVRDDSKVYTSMPPQYGYNCPKCGAMEFDTVIYDNPEMEEQKPVVTHGETYHVDTLGTQQMIAGKMPQKHMRDIVSCDAIESCMLRYLQSAANRNDDTEIIEDTKAYKSELISIIEKERKPAEWSEEDSGIIGTLSSIIFDYAFNKDALDENNDLTGEYAELDNWLKLLPERFNLQSKVKWSEKDERMKNRLIDRLNFIAYRQPTDATTVCMSFESEISWLKSLRPQSKIEWSEEDEKMRLEAIKRIDELEFLGIPCNDVRKVLESLRSRPKPSRSWKPTEEQMLALADTLEHIPEFYKPKCTLESLERDLKKL